MWGVGRGMNGGISLGVGNDDMPSTGNWQGKNRYRALVKGMTTHAEAAEVCPFGVGVAVDGLYGSDGAGSAINAGKMGGRFGVGAYTAAGISGNIGLYFNVGAMMNDALAGPGGTLRNYVWQNWRLVFTRVACGIIVVMAIPVIALMIYFRKGIIGEDGIAIFVGGILVSVCLLVIGLLGLQGALGKWLLRMEERLRGKG
jgi:hypothetical protein